MAVNKVFENVSTWLTNIAIAGLYAVAAIAILAITAELFTIIVIVVCSAIKLIFRIL